jgi:hypothetical protein
MPTPRRDALGPQRIAVLRPKGGGVSTMRKLLTETRQLAEKAARLDLDDLADIIVQETRVRAPIDTGELRAAIDKHRGGRDGKSIVVAVDEGKAPHAQAMNAGMVDFASRPDGLYNLGPGSRAANQGPPHAEPRGVGVRFMERGAEAAVSGLRRRLESLKRKTVAAVARAAKSMLGGS